MLADEVKKYFLSLQDSVCDVLLFEDHEGNFVTDTWQQKTAAGGGTTKVMENGAVIEKAGVNFSHVYGAELVPAATLRHPDLVGCGFEAMGVSVIIHPKNPFVPTAHLNVRFIQVKRKDGSSFSWFGGGFDLTPYYGFVEDCRFWHQQAKAACDPYGIDVYPRFKKWADDYFYLKHRAEPRGIGGIFFDDLYEWGLEKTFQFVQRVGDGFITAYQPILAKRKMHQYGSLEREFQLYRRGRYVEFNLIYDRGTLFGLQSQGRVESILVSLPPKVSWKYAWQPVQNSREQELYSKFLQPHDWSIEDVE